MRYVGKPVTVAEAYQIYDIAFSLARIKAAQALADVDNPQLNTMRVLAATLKGLVFDE